MEVVKPLELEMEEKAKLLQWCLPRFGFPYLCSYSYRGCNSYAVEPADNKNRCYHVQLQPNGDLRLLQQIKPPNLRSITS